MYGFPKHFSVDYFSSWLDSLFLFPCLFCTATRRLNFLAKFPITSAFLWVLDGSDFSVLLILRFKFCFVENTEDVIGIVFEVDIAVLTHSCFDIFFLKKYFLTRASSFVLNTSYFFGYTYFILSLSVFLLFQYLWPPFFWSETLE